MRIDNGKKDRWVGFVPLIRRTGFRLCVESLHESVQRQALLRRTKGHIQTAEERESKEMKAGGEPGCFDGDPNGFAEDGEVVGVSTKPPADRCAGWYRLQAHSEDICTAEVPTCGQSGSVWSYRQDLLPSHSSSSPLSRRSDPSLLTSLVRGHVDASQREATYRVLSASSMFKSAGQCPQGEGTWPR